MTSLKEPSPDVQDSRGAITHATDQNTCTIQASQGTYDTFPSLLGHLKGRLMPS